MLQSHFTLILALVTGIFSPDGKIDCHIPLGMSILYNHGFFQR